ncbi:MAG: hypothetical protein RMK84_18185 [Oscillochloridaceae bacterium]|nr:hypothetical protein [Chloroflexaceae bacterium]MDW8392055.1 hypothetical protein [Oscillochloridaceae bacterium]
MRSLVFVATLLGSVTLFIGGLLPAALAQGSPVLIAENLLPRSEDVKRPHVDTLPASGQPHTVLVSGVAERSEARLWSKPDSVPLFPGPQVMGAAEGQPDNTTTSIFVAPDRTIYYAWVNANANQIFLRARRPGEADFGPPQLIVSDRAFPNDVEVGANEDGVFVFWRLADGVIQYRRSRDGVSWPDPPVRLMPGVALRRMDVAAGPGRQLIIGYTKPLGDALQVYVSIWNRETGAFFEERIPTVTDRPFADPHVALNPGGGYFVAFRSDDGVLGGAWFSERPASGAWSQPGRLVKGRVSSIAVDVDGFGNVHLAWIGDATGTPDLFYAFRRSGGSFEGPLLVRSGALPIFNLQLAANARDQSYAHIVAERFTGGGLRGQYYLFGAPVALVNATSIRIEGGAASTNRPVVGVAFIGLQGEPNEVRWRWGAPPTDQENDSGGYRPLTNPLSVPAPSLPDPTRCTPAVLYTQLRRGSVFQLEPNSGAITFDRAVQTAVAVVGPLAGFDPAYTNQPSATIELNNAAECSGLVAAVVSGPLNVPGGALPLEVAGRLRLEVTVGLTGDPGPKTLRFAFTDSLGNGLVTERTIVYDPVRPVFDAGSAVLTLTPSPQGTSVLELALDNVVVGDDARLFGIVVRPELTPAGGGAPVAGRPLVLSFGTMNEVITSEGRLRLRATVNLARSFSSSQLAPGVYRLAITFADAAGNESLANIVSNVNLERITFPVMQPLVSR